MKELDKSVGGVVSEIPSSKLQSLSASNDNTVPATRTTNAVAQKAQWEASINGSKKKKLKRFPLHVEAIINPCCPVSINLLQNEIEVFVKNVGNNTFMYKEGEMDLSNAPVIIQKSCLQISIVDIPSSSTTNHINNDNYPGADSQPLHNKNDKIASWSISNIFIHCYTLSTEPAEPEEIDDLNDSNDQPITVCDVLQLPHQSLHTSWENLIFPQYIKDNIIGYAESALLFATKNVSSHIISWNRVLLLHGPPGTGKTSLCRSLAHKLSIRLNHIYTNGGYLIEIQSHSLFSKWFSESGKLIAKLFDRIKEMVEDEPNSLFCVLIDEVESLASSRVGGSAGDGAAEPSDAVRAVNSLLTSLDSIRSYKNVLMLTTTNITSSIDDAFVDRVDLKQYIGYPCLEARYEILKSCIDELLRVGIIDNAADHKLKSFSYAFAAMNDDQSKDGNDRQGNNDNIMNAETKESSSCYYEKNLLQCAIKAINLSGRSLRKIPFQSHAFFVRSLEMVSLNTFLSSLKQGIEKEKRSRQDLNEGKK